MYSYNSYTPSQTFKFRIVITAYSEQVGGRGLFISIIDMHHLLPHKLMADDVVPSKCERLEHPLKLETDTSYQTDYRKMSSYTPQLHVKLIANFSETLRENVGEYSTEVWQFKSLDSNY